jgi:anion-transporting  ArsA/GET3 family ATPase
MPQILTFLGKGGSGRTTVAIAAAKQQANLGRRVLFVSQDPTPATGILLGMPLLDQPQSIGANLDVVSISVTMEIERSWEDVKLIEAQYLRSPILRNVYGQELAILPGMDSAIALNALRKYDASGKYDTIVYDGTGDISTLRMVGMADGLSWYLRRFVSVVEESDLWRTISPIMQPAMAAIMTIAWTGESGMSQPLQAANSFLSQSQVVMGNPQRVVGYLVSTPDTAAISTAKYLWGSAQQSGLTIGGMILNQCEQINAVAAEFDPLAVAIVPVRIESDWQPLIDAMPDFSQAINSPKPIEIDIAGREVKLYLPGFDKTQVKLTQSGPEVTIEAGSQRRNILLPPQLKGSSVTGAKFQGGYLIISF